MPAGKNSIIQHVPGIYRKVITGEGSPKALQVAPVLTQNAYNGEYQIMKTNPERYDLRNPILKTGDAAGFVDLDLQYATVQFAQSRVAGGMITIPARALQSLEAGNSDLSPLEDAVSSVTQHMFAGYTNEFLDVADAGLADGTTLDLSTPSAEDDLLEFFQAEMRVIQLNSGYRPNVFYCGREAFDKLATHDALAQGVAVSSTETGTRRLGSNDPAFAQEWFRSRLGLELVVDEFVQTNTSGTDEFTVGSEGILAHAQGGSAQSCFKTMVQTLGRGEFAGELITVMAKEIGIEAGIDEGSLRVAASAAWSIQVVDDNLGLRIPITLS